jgi:Tol biopolymer transport system component
MIVAAVLMACAAALLVAMPEKAEATFPGKNGKIAYVNNGVIYTINPGGGGKTKVTEGRDPSWSPNGKRIAFTGHDGHDYEIYTISATGGSRFNVTNNTSDDLQPSYSPDGKKIAYVAHRGTGEGSAQKYDSEIYTVNVGGGGRAKVTNDSAYDFGPSYLPDGKKIAYRSESFGVKNDYEIYTINVGGGRRFNVTDNKSEDSAPSYSPGGKKIAYEAYYTINSDSEIYTINAGGGGRFNLTNNNTSETEPSYSPNGKRIAFSGWDGHDWEIYTINVGGGGRVKVTKGGSPSWGSLP